MKDDYDFTEAERGKFFVEAAALVPPAHPEAEARGASLSELVNDLLRADIAVIKAAG